MDELLREFDMANATCMVPDCGKPIKRGGYCYGHYMKNWRYGTPTPESAPGWVDIKGERYGSLVVIDRIDQEWRCLCDCGQERRVSAGDLNRYGDVSTCGDRRIHRRAEYAGYGAAHQRCCTDRGKAQTHDCVGCGRPAQHWSYNHDDPDELTANGLSARPVAYSLHSVHYSPRCVPCHKRFDLGRRNSMQSPGSSSVA